MLLLPAAPMLAADDTAPPRGAQWRPWSSLDSEQRQLLSQFESRWGELPPQRQFALSRGAARWARMNADEKARASDRFRRWRNLDDRRRDADPRALE